jgi:NADP-dependent 3-hydroxy acid dehydrogenase YdfG
MTDQDIGHRRVVVVTGAASGIGRATSDSLLASGWNVIEACREAADAHRPGQGQDRRVRVSGDLADPRTPSALLNAAMQHFGRCDALINNAGVIEVGTIEDVDIDAVCHMVRINVEAAFRAAYTFLKHFRQQGSGHLINVSSVLGTKVREGAGAYAGTKHAMEALTESLRLELAGTDVAVSSIQPGLVSSSLHRRFDVPPAQRLGVAEPLQPEDIAACIDFILSQPRRVRIARLMVLPAEHRI